LLLERADSVRPASYLAAAGVGHIAIVDADTTCNEKSLMERRRLELQSVNRPNGWYETSTHISVYGPMLKNSPRAMLLGSYQKDSHRLNHGML
jgi:hypothetical protein